MLFFKDHGQTDASKQSRSEYRPRRKFLNSKQIVVDDAQERDGEQDLPEVDLPDTADEHPCKKDRKYDAEQADPRKRPHSAYDHVYSSQNKQQSPENFACVFT